MKRHAVWLAVAAVVTLPSGCSREEVTGIRTLSASSAAEPTTLRNVILFTALQSGAQPQFAVINSDGSGRRLLTHDEHGYQYPAISPDGKRIAFTRFRSDGNTEGLFLMNADGSGQSLLIHRSLFIDDEPAWSPDGSRIAFQSYDDGPFGPLPRIFVINVDGTGLRQLSPPIDEQTEFAFDEGPTWSPDGTRLAFTRTGRLHVINADGTGFTALPNEDDAENASWSPDGRHIAYQALDGPGNIRIRDADGSNPVTVSSTPEQQGWPRWSADSRRLVVNRVIGGRLQLFVLNIDGTGETRLSFGTPDAQPNWSPFPAARSGAGVSIVIAPTDAKLAPSDTRQFTATVRATTGNAIDHASVAWSTSDPGVATVTASGLVTAIDNGTAQIQAVFGSDTARAQVRVADRVLRNVIVYSTDEFGYPELAAVKPDGTGRRRLTMDQFGYRSPDVSPDGRRIAFSTGFSTFVINADAAGISEGFTDVFSSFSGSSPDSPAWSPGGSQIALSAGEPGPFGPARRIFVVNADGTGLRQLSPDDPDPNQFYYSDDGPTWSPDGTRLIFTRNGALQVINADGTGLTPLPNDDHAALPDWSPDGTRIAYASATPGLGIRIRNADGSNPFTVTSGQDSHPRWAPDNHRLVFQRVVDGKSQLFIVNADGTGETKLSAGTGQETAPSWSPVP